MTDKETYSQKLQKYNVPAYLWPKDGEKSVMNGGGAAAEAAQKKTAEVPAARKGSK